MMAVAAHARMPWPSPHQSTGASASTLMHRVITILPPRICRGDRHHLPASRSRPHQSRSDVGWIGRGQGLMPGEVSLAHDGILFLDELPEFRRHVLEVLR
jgi:predicted ATPase with chaperone activity